MERTPILLVAWFVVFLAIAFAAVPLMLRLFVYLHTRIGNGEHWVIRWLDAHHWQIVWGVWAFFALGLLIALPTMVRDGFFNPPM
jgi:ABC-type sulfate transport system permease subunit